MPIPGVGQNEAALAAARYEPICWPDCAPICPTRDANACIVLLRAVDVIRESVVHGNMVKLRGRLVILGRPRFSAVDRDTRPTVIGVRDPIRILWIDPEAVMIAAARCQ